MRTRFVWLLAASLLLGSASAASAELVRFHYVPIDASGRTSAVAIGPNGAVGERQTWIGGAPQPYTTQFRPTHMATFRHPANGGLVVVPLTLPQGTPNIEYRSDRIVHNYGSYTVEAIFLDDGSVDIVYNSGFFRPLQVQ
jgi:hypothetical protein